MGGTHGAGWGREESRGRPGRSGGHSLLPWGRYSGRSDAGCLYELTVRLLSEHEDVLAEFSSGQVAVPPDDDDGGWVQVSPRLGAGPGARGGTHPG